MKQIAQIKKNQRNPRHLRNLWFRQKEVRQLVAAVIYSQAASGHTSAAQDLMQQSSILGCRQDACTTIVVQTSSLPGGWPGQLAPQGFDEVEMARGLKLPLSE